MRLLTGDRRCHGFVLYASPATMADGRARMHAPRIAMARAPCPELCLRAAEKKGPFLSAGTCVAARARHAVGDGRWRPDSEPCRARTVGICGHSVRHNYIGHDYIGIADGISSARVWACWYSK